MAIVGKNLLNSGNRNKARRRHFTKVDVLYSYEHGAHGLSIWVRIG